MAWFSGTDVDGRRVLVDTATGAKVYLNADGTPEGPRTVSPPPDGTSPPPEPAPCVADAAFVVSLYYRYLGRGPESDGAVAGRVGRPCAVVEDEISHSPEAVAYAEAHGGGPPPTGNGGAPKPPPPPAAAPPPAVGDSATSILLGLAQHISDLLNAVGGIKDAIAQRVADAIGKAAPIIGKTVADVTAKLGNAVTQLVPTTLNLIGSALGGVESIAGAFLSNAADVSDVAGAFVSAISGEKDGLAGFAAHLGYMALGTISDHLGATAADGESIGDAVTAAHGMVDQIIAATYAHIDRKAGLA